MKITRWLLPAVVFFLSFYIAGAQTDSSCHVRISVLTCTPGSELYSTFGHTAIRVIDSTRRTDLVFNWGTFDFDDPDFYMKFVRGKLEYFLSVEPYNEFIRVYQYEQRSIWEQVLSIDCSHKKQMLNALSKNLQGANRYYKYDFLLDNCTSRVRDIVFANLSGLAITDSLVQYGFTYRNQIHEYLDEGAKPWSKLGIDILLGSMMDKPVTNWNAMFLPDYLMQGLDESNLAAEGVIEPSNIIYQASPPDIQSWKYAPLMIFSIICTLFFGLSLLKNRWAVSITRLFDSLLLYITGLLGILLLFMWFGTDHTVCQKNYNLLWALPTNIFAAFFLWKKALWLRRYFLLLALIYGMLLVTWFWLPQQLNIALIPLVLYLLLRCSKLAKIEMPVKLPVRKKK
ncbi:Lnb N-terminal periplasmic domain-containing protein [Foetidibacter luteolus]|uniref:Lnb N-terminal periplasmic domain-containing protein n=1 Tax=Foetidibacter luteolus TaxID=2608880 RepID=UPI00129BE5DA|nr:DUF4105 domain-containing protein [Foetidibacter luteolus]